MTFLLYNIPALPLPIFTQGGLGEVWRLAPQSSLLIKELLQRLGVTVIDWYTSDDDDDGFGDGDDEDDDDGGDDANDSFA